MRYNKIHMVPMFLLLLALGLGGCAGKQDQQITLQTHIPKAGSPQKENFSSKELAALHTTGHIDRNLPANAMPDVAKEYKNYLRKGRNSMCMISKQSEPYLAYAQKVFREQGMPEELANLAIVESGYRPAAVSRAGAAGAWQFMPATGLKYGLAQDEWQDERLDPWKATEAAAQYLRKLYNDFGDWPTAIAAYNAGEGKLQRAKEGTGGKDFFEVVSRNHVLDEKKQLKEETQNYVPRFLAVSKIMRNLPELGFAPINPDETETILRFTARPGTDLKDFSKACNLNWEEFIAHNKHHKRTITCTDRQTNVYVPARARELAANYLCSAQPANFAGWKMASVASANDTLEKISSRTKIPLARLKAANPGLGRLKAGQNILVPAQTSLLAAAPPALKKGNSKIAQKDVKKPAGITHAIAGNDTLYSIAKKYNVELKDLMALNNISEPGKLRKGGKLAIPGNKPAPAPHKGSSQGKIGKRKPTSYVVQGNDSLWKIAKKHNISVEDLKKWNKITEKNLRPGSTLTVAR